MKFDEVVSELLGDGYSARFVATGDSMYPSIRSGDTLELEPADPADLRIGDVVLVRAQRGLTAHRIVAITPESVITRGDNCLRRDPSVPFSAVIGRVIHPRSVLAASPLRKQMLYLRTIARRVQGFFKRNSD